MPMPFALGLAAEKNPTQALRSHASGNTLSVSQWRTPCANPRQGEPKPEHFCLS